MGDMFLDAANEIIKDNRKWESKKDIRSDYKWQTKTNQENRTNKKTKSRR